MVRRSSLVLTLLAILLVLLGCSSTPPAVSEVVIDQGDVVLEVGQTVGLSVTVRVVGGASTEVTWVSSDEAVATVSGAGVVTGVAEGEASVVAASAFDDSRSASVMVTVLADDAPAVVSVSIDQDDVALLVGATAELTATVEVVGGASDAVVWSSEDASIATVSDEGVVTGVAVGEATVVATSAFDDSRSDSVTVTVEAVGPYPYGDEVELGQAATELLVEGVSVRVPAVGEGGAASVNLAVVDAPHGVEMPLVGLSRVVALRLAGDLRFAGAAEGVAPLLGLSLPPVSVPDSVSRSAGGFADAPVLALVWVRVDGGPWVGLGAQAVWDEGAGEFVVSVAHPEQACVADGVVASSVGSCELVWQVVDVAPLVAAEEALGDLPEVGGDGLSASAVMGSRAPGLYQVDMEAFLERGASCDSALDHAFRYAESMTWERRSRTAVVFVHGWQTLAGMLKGRAGDAPHAMPVHCGNWERMLAGIATWGGPWNTVRGGADVFTFRYNSNRRVHVAGEGLAARLLHLHSRGYERLVLVGHSMGGLVIHDARSRILDGSSPLGAADLPVITLATPYMGGPILCTFAVGGFCAVADGWSLTAVWGSVPVFGLDSTLDLASAMRISNARLRDMGHTYGPLGLGGVRPYERNPYLLRLWERVNMRDPNLTVFLGSNGVSPFFADAFYHPAAFALTPAWGPNDGVVPVASAVAAVDFTRASPTPRFSGLVRDFGRDHGFMVRGCEHGLSTLWRCPPGVYAPDDVYLDDVAFEVARWLLPVAVSMLPDAATLPVGGTVEFTASVTGTLRKGVTWHASSSCGSITGSGNTITYTAPATAGDCEVTATSVAVPAASATANVTVTARPVVSVSVEPSAVTLPVNGTQTFTVTVTGATDTSVTWEASCGSVTGSGATVTYTAPASVPAGGSCLVRGTSVEDDRAWAEAVVTIEPHTSDPPPTGPSTTIAAGWHHSLAVRTDGSVWAWGANSQGQLGDGTTTTRHTPVQVSDLTNVTGIAAGDYHSLAVREDGAVWAWGYNWRGQLGDGTTTDRHTPVQVSDLTNVSSITAGNYQSLALRTDGTVWAWGSNCCGQLGDGTATHRHTPVQVSDLTNVSSIAAGDGHSLALRTDGTVWAWGQNWYGQLGDGTTTDRHTPVQVSGLSQVTSIVAGATHSLALRSDGTVWAWGDNEFGQLGDGTATHRHTPVQVSDLTNVSRIAAGDCHSLALRTDGSVWAWGYNSGGQLGDGTTTTRHTPVQVSDLTNVSSVTAGDRHSSAVRADGTVWAWGTNVYGQLGDGTTSDRLTPVQVSGLSNVRQP